ncbi:alpha/beta hydrolase [Oceanicola sp. 502str15]|uniref:alpha/beta hydrolase n=1 Tax=Oceanicola sp. 502str15 TaxID=2696061 RepID=UPI002094D808|nr:alpha/beta hydrolase [Oceanicola sp. 502str15]MCO6384651.1 alpha/beta hydrolase fold domain-containing protein [Oceanicola sp. 502str15]
MTYSFDMSPEAKLALAGELREGTLLPPTITPEMEADLAAVTVEELAVPTRVGPSRVMKVTPAEGTAPRPCFINFHGGGFVRGYHRRDTMFCAQLARATGALVLDVDYRLAPEHPFPAGLHECHDVVAWTFEQAGALGIDPARIAIGGHSAGGNFTASICQMAQESGAFRVCGQLLDYPFLDAATPPEDKIDPRSIMPAERMHAFNVLYCQVPENMRNPLVSPVLAAPELLEGQPPALMIVAGLDPLRHEAHRYAGQLIAAGVDIEVRQFDDCDHGWVVSGKARHEEARARIFGWLNRLYG